MNGDHFFFTTTTADDFDLRFVSAGNDVKRGVPVLYRRQDPPTPVQIKCYFCGRVLGSVLTLMCGPYVCVRAECEEMRVIYNKENPYYS